MEAAAALVTEEHGLSPVSPTAKETVLVIAYDLGGQRSRAVINSSIKELGVLLEMVYVCVLNCALAGRLHH